MFDGYKLLLYGKGNHKTFLDSYKEKVPISDFVKSVDKAT